LTTRIYRNLYFLRIDYRNSTSNGTYRIYDNVVFVTLRAQLSHFDSEESFNISYTSIKRKYDSNIYKDYASSHYHFSAESGSLTYKELTGRDEYLRRQLITVVVSGQAYQTFTVDSIDIEKSSNCTLDSLTRLVLSPDKYFFQRCGVAAQDYR